MSLQLNFSDQLLLMDLSDYDESALLAHIAACHRIADNLPSHYRINGAGEEVIRGKTSFRGGIIEGNDRESSKSRSKRICDDNSSEVSDVFIDPASDSSPAFTSITLSPAATDSVRCACLSSARMAVVQVVLIAGKSVSGLLAMFFREEKGSAWIGDQTLHRTALLLFDPWFFSYYFQFLSRRRCV